jgi:hypothetical protein
MSYSIYTLWGELDNGEKAPVEVKLPVDFFQQTIWKVVVEREDEKGFVVQKDVTEGLTLDEALAQKNNLIQVYRADGFITLNNLNLYPPGGAEGRTVIFLDVESKEKNLIPA